MNRFWRKIFIAFLLFVSFGVGAGSRDELADWINGRSVSSSGKATREAVQQAQARAIREQEAIREIQMNKERLARKAEQGKREVEEMGGLDAILSD